MDEDQGDGVGVGPLLGERPSAFQAALADPYGGVAMAGPGGRLLAGGEHGGELKGGRLHGVAFLGQAVGAPGWLAGDLLVTEQPAPGHCFAQA
ncbi:hypothetical protein AS594_35595 [Streptomyces agglomeratus]|uniref:Uncharacterized protein n=1 Tax=Streptomyces agglomeratus TaxID=285458 RepID=A0A1E5PHF6_9ACTN|nr:hypothetical protein AS594_35595 [Streptomyces agglomeratus]